MGMITRKDLAAPITSTGINLKIKTSKKTTVLKGQQLKPAKRRLASGPVRGQSLAHQESDVAYEELRS